MLEIQKPKGPATLVSDRRLCVTADKSTVVEATDSRAAYLLVGEGSEILVEDVEKYDLHVVDGKFVLPSAEPEQLPLEPQEPPAA